MDGGGGGGGGFGGGGGGGGFGGHGGGFGGPGGGFGGHGGGFGGGHHGPGGFGGHGGGFGGPGGGFGGHGGGFRGGHHGPGGFGGPGGFLGGPGGFFGGPGGGMGGPPLAPWLGALAVTAVAASAISPYSGYGNGRQGMVVWSEEGREVSAPVNMLTVRICQAQNLKKVQLLGKQDPYVRGKLYFSGHQIGECRSSTHVDGGRNPIWQNMSKSVFTFYVPATVTLDRMTLALEVINDNLISDGRIGTTGSIPLSQAANGQSKWWSVSTGGTIEAIIELVPHDAPATNPNTAYSGRNAGRYNGAGNGTGGRVAVVNPSPHVAVTRATPSSASGGYYGGVNGGSASAMNQVPVYEAQSAPAAGQYRPPPVAPTGGGYVAGRGYQDFEKNSYGVSSQSFNGTGAALPEARAVPILEGSRGADDPYNARGAAASASVYGGVGAPAGYAPSSAYPNPTPSSSSQQRYQPQQQQWNPANQGGYNPQYGKS